MASIIGVETLQHTNGTTAATIAADGKFTAPNLVMPTGSVLQVVYAETTSSNVAIVHNGWTAIGLTALITPSSTSSKILVDFTPQFKLQVSSGSDVGVGWKVLRGGTSIEETATTYHTYFYEGGGFIDTRGTDRICTLDTPSSTSQQTYTFEARSYNSMGTKTVQDQGNKSRVILMEIAG